MAVDQDLLDQIAGTIADLYRDVETALVKTIAQRLRKDLPSPFQEDKLDAVRQLQAAAQAIVLRLQKARIQAIRQAIADAYRTGQQAALVGVPKAIADQARVAETVIPNARIIENLAQALHRDVGRVDMNILRAPVDAYRAVQAATAARIATGSWTRREAAQAAWSKLISEGITSFTDRANRRWKLSSYVEMMARTNIQRAAVQGQTDRLADIGIDLIYISDNVQECKICRPFESKVLRRGAGPIGDIRVEHATRDDELVTVHVLDTLAGAMAKGLFHPNCRHSASAYLPGVTKLKKGTEDPDGYKAREKQRYLERKIRAAKEQEVGALTPEAKKDAAADVRAAQAALRAHLKAHPSLKRLPYREQIGAGNIPKGEAPGGPVTDLHPSPPTTPTPDLEAANKAAEAQAEAERKALEQAEAEARAKQEAERAAAEEKARKEAEAKAKAEEEAAKKAAIAKAKQEAAEAARRAAEQAQQQAAQPATRGMRHGLRHRDNKASVAWAHTLPNVKDLPDEQRKAVVGYTGDEYLLVNNGLRGRRLTPEEQERFPDLVRNLDAAIDSSRTPESVLVHREMDSGYTYYGLKVNQEQPAEMYGLVGKVFEEPGYWSTSVGMGYTDGSTIQLMIRVPAGYPMLNVMPVSLYGEGEREVVLRRGARYVIHAVHRKRDAWVIEVEIVPDGWTPPADWTPDPYGPDDGPGSTGGAT
jgi:hypothetical protein